MKNVRTIQVNVEFVDAQDVRGVLNHQCEIDHIVQIQRLGYKKEWQERLEAAMRTLLQRALK